MVTLDGVMYMVLGAIYGELLYLGLQKIFKFKEDHSSSNIIKGILTFAIGYGFAMITNKVWFIALPVVIIVALGFKFSEKLVRH